MNPIRSFEQSASEYTVVHSTGSILPSQLWVVAVEVPVEVPVLLPVLDTDDDTVLLPDDVAVTDAELVADEVTDAETDELNPEPELLYVRDTLIDLCVTFPNPQGVRKLTQTGGNKKNQKKI